MKKTFMTFLGAVLIMNTTAIARPYTDEVVTLKGNIISKTTQNPHGKMKTDFLHLTKSIDYISSDGVAGDMDNIDTVQIIWGTKKLRNSKGCIVLTGELFGAHTAYHHAPVLIDVKHIQPCN